MPLSKIEQSSVNTGVAGTGPAFSAYASSTTSLSGGVYTKVAFQTEEFDTASCFNNTGSTVGSIPAYAFLPNVAGYYQINASVQISGGTTAELAPAVFKNGVVYKYGNDISSTTAYALNAAVLVYLNGSTDYIEIYCYSGTAKTVSNSIPGTFFQASMVRSV